MAHTRTQRRENELPYIPFGPFQIRLPFIHYKIESVEFIQGLILGVTALAAVPYLEQYLGLPYELAWSCVIIETFLYLLHSLLGDPVVPGWITPTLPLTIVFLEGFPMGKERIQAMIALQMLVGLVFIFMGVTRLADKHRCRRNPYAEDTHLINDIFKLRNLDEGTDLQSRGIQFANQKSYYHCDKIGEKISVSRNKIKKLICFSLLLIFVREADQDQETYTCNNSQRIFVHISILTQLSCHNCNRCCKKDSAFDRIGNCMNKFICFTACSAIR